MEGLASSYQCGVLVARAWQETGSRVVRIRLTWAADGSGRIASTTPHNVVVDTREDLLDVVATWFARVAGDPPPGDP